jgi:hypothetical protein
MGWSDENGGFRYLATPLGVAETSDPRGNPDLGLLSSQYQARPQVHQEPIRTTIVSGVCGFRSGHAYVGFRGF